MILKHDGSYNLSGQMLRCASCHRLELCTISNSRQSGIGGSKECIRPLNKPLSTDTFSTISTELSDFSFTDTYPEAELFSDEGLVDEERLFKLQLQVIPSSTPVTWTEHENTEIKGNSNGPSPNDVPTMGGQDDKINSFLANILDNSLDSSNVALSDTVIKRNPSFKVSVNDNSLDSSWPLEIEAVVALLDASLLFEAAAENSFSDDGFRSNNSRSFKSTPASSPVHDQGRVLDGPPCASDVSITCPEKKSLENPDHHGHRDPQMCVAFYF